MRQIEADSAENGMMILANAQTGGKGQRGKQWVTPAGDALLMSLILRPKCSLQHQAQFMAAVALSVVRVCTQFLPSIPIQIKWPNDIIIADKKAGGILIENVLRGSSWEWAVIGIGLNVYQIDFPKQLPLATSLQIHAKIEVSIRDIARMIRTKVLETIADSQDSLVAFNEHLYRRRQQQKFSQGQTTFWAEVERMDEQGHLVLKRADGTRQSITHGAWDWVW